MSTSLNNIESILDSIPCITESDRIALSKEIKCLEKELNKLQFKLSRTTQDRRIAEKVLNTTILNLEDRQREIQQINLELLAQKKLLKKQNEVIAEKSEKLKDNLKKLEHSYKEMEEFTYIASHDLKSPLRTISNFAQLLKRKNFDKLDTQSKEFIDFIVSGVQQMDEVICDSLEYSKVGKEGQATQTVNLNNIIQIVLFNLKKEIDETNAVVHIENLPIVNGYKTSLLQLFQNLISNAIKFRGDQSPVIHISCIAQCGGYTFHVCDNGVGMNEQYQNKAFQPFQRLNDRQKPGTGIGLAICMKIVKMHNGEIHYTANDGPGTTFTFTLLDKQKTAINKAV